MRQLVPVLILLPFTVAGPARAAARAPAPAAFAPCSTCHSLDKGVNLIGPSLHGVYGRKKASVPGYDYSVALKAKGGVWAATDLDAYIRSPGGYAPGTKMAFAGLSDPARRAAVIAFLKAAR